MNFQDWLHTIPTHVREMLKLKPSEEESQRQFYASLGMPPTASNDRPTVSAPAARVLALPDGNHPEGIVVDSEGTVYLSNRRGVTDHGLSEIIRLELDQSSSIWATLPDTTDPLGNGVLGLALDARENLYAALDSRHPDSRGVWRISAGGARQERVPGSEHMAFPNALAFDAEDTLYATDSTGSVWRFPQNGSEVSSPWLRHPWLEPFPFAPFAIPLPEGGFLPMALPGANGIAFFPPNHLYVANTEKGLIVHIPINSEQKTPGQPRIAAGNPIPAEPGQWRPDLRLWTVDGIAVDADGAVYGVLPGFAALAGLLGIEPSPLVRVEPASGEVELTPVDASVFHTPLSLAFGAGHQNRESLFVANGALMAGLVPGPGPGVVQADIGISESV